MPVFEKIDGNDVVIRFNIEEQVRKPKKSKKLFIF